MKKAIQFFSLLLVGLCGWQFSNAQNIGINTTGAVPNASAGLDIDFNNKGLLVPRVALTGTNLAGPITTPATSLLVYNTATVGGANAVSPGFYYWDGSQWVRLTSATFTDTDDQTLSTNGDTLFIADGNFVILNDNTFDGDSSMTNELQALSLSNDTLYLSNGGFAVLPNQVLTLDDAYDAAGRGLGRTIIADTGAVSIVGLDGIQVTGTHGSGLDLTLSGAGTKMFFYPKKSAFRAGYTSNAYWDNDSIGNYSFATGGNTKAKGIYSSAMGFNQNVTGTAGTALGTGHTVNGHVATALGGGNTASGSWSTATGIQTSALGQGSFTSGEDNFAVADHSTSFGRNNRSEGVYSFTTGHQLLANSFLETVVGRYNDTANNSSGTAWVGTDRLFSVGNGSGTSNRNNAFTIYKDGSGYLNGELTLSNGTDSITFPNTDGTNGQVLTTDGSGNITWQAAAAGWNLTGNSGTNPSTNFVGTIDSQDLVFRTHNTERMRINATGNVGIGSAATTARLYVRVPNTNNSTTYGISSQNYSSSNSTKYGIRSEVSSDGTGSRYGIYNRTFMNSASSGAGIGMYNYLTAYGGATYAGLYNYVNFMGDSVSNNKYGQYNFVNIGSSSNTSDVYGEYTLMDYSAGNRYGEYKEISSDYTVYGAMYGDYNELKGSGDGDLYGHYNYVSNSGDGNKYGVYNDFQAVNGSKYGVYNTFAGGAYFGTIYGVFNDINADGTMTKTGIHNELAAADGQMIGSYQQLQPGGGNGNDMFGFYTFIQDSGSGTHYGLVADVPGGNNDFAAVFNRGNVVANELAGDYDFRVEGTSATHALMVDASANSVGVNVAAPTARLDVDGDARVRNLPQGNTTDQLVTADASGNLRKMSLDSVGGSGWGLNGNAGTNPSTNFLGTTDNQELSIRTYDTVRIRITNKGQIEPDNNGLSVFIGQSAGENDDLTTNRNVFIGDVAGMDNTSGSLNVAVGANSLTDNTTGSDNTALGVSSLFRNTTGSDNVAVGTYALLSNTTGTGNVAVGEQSQYNTSTGGFNTSVGHNALISNTTARYNSAFGYRAMYSNTTGTDNIGVGSNALYDNTTGELNTALGVNALDNNSTGDNNTALGYDALGIMGSGTGNMALGYRVANNLTVGFANTYLGYDIDAVTSSDTNRLNIANYIFGTHLDGRGSTISDAHLGIGVKNPLARLHIEDPNDPVTVYIRGRGVSGESVDASIVFDDDGAAGLSYNGAGIYYLSDYGSNKAEWFSGRPSSIGYSWTTVFGDSYVIGRKDLGTTNGHDSTTADPGNILFQVDNNGRVGIGLVNPAYQLQLSTNSAAKPTSGAWTVASDARLKTDVKPFEGGLNTLLKINPVWFKYNGKAGISTSEGGVGTIAQDLKKVAPYMVKEWNHYDTSGDSTTYLGVDYGAMDFLLINSVKELNMELKALQLENAALKKKEEAMQSKLDSYESLLQGILQRVNALEKAKTSTD